MTQSNIKIAGYACMVLAVVFLFVAWERYSSNAKAVETANQLLSNSPMGKLTNQSILEPNVPVATTYAILFAAISGIAGAVFIAASWQNLNTKRGQPGFTFATDGSMKQDGASATIP